MLRQSCLRQCHVVGIKYHLAICMSLLKRLWLLNYAFRHLDQNNFDLVKSSLFRYLKFRLYKFDDSACLLFKLLDLINFMIDLISSIAFKKWLQSLQEGLRLFLLAFKLHIIRDEMLDPPPYFFRLGKSACFLCSNFR